MRNVFLIGNNPLWTMPVAICTVAKYVDTIYPFTPIAAQCIRIHLVFIVHHEGVLVLSDLISVPPISISHRAWTIWILGIIPVGILKSTDRFWIY